MIARHADAQCVTAWQTHPLCVAFKMGNDLVKRWLVRLAMSFFIIAAVLLWEAYRGAQRGLETWRITLDLVGAAAAIALGVAGTREKHRPRP